VIKKHPIKEKNPRTKSYKKGKPPKAGGIRGRRKEGKGLVVEGKTVKQLRVSFKKKKKKKFKKKE